MWSRLWRIRLPHKIKIVTWRLFYNRLPISSNLRKRGCETNLTSVFCGFKEESTRHVFIDCWWTKNFWSMLNVGAWSEAVSEFFGDWIWFILNSSDLESKEDCDWGVDTLEK